MINIMVDDSDDKLYQIDEDTGEQVKKEPSITIDIVRAKLPKLKKEREEMIKQEFSQVVVHEFGDEYHLSEEERKKKFKYYEAFKSFSKYKHKFRKFPDYIKAMREALKCLDLVAQDNFVYSPDKFKKLFFKGKIWIKGLVLPEFKGAGRRSVDTEYLLDYILSDAPAEDFLKKDDHEVYTKEELDDAFEELFTKEEQEAIDTAIAKEKDGDDEYFCVPSGFYTDDDDIPDKMIVPISKKEMKKSIKALPDLGNLFKEIEKKSKRGSKIGMSGYISNMLMEDFDNLDEYDGSKEVFLSKMPVFKGDMTNDTEYYKYLAKLDEWERTQIKKQYNGKLKTQEEIDAIELKKALENHNWDIRNLFGNKERAKKLERIRKEQIRKEKEIKKKLIKLQEAKKRRQLGDDYDEEEVKKNKKKAKKLKKKGKKAMKEIDKETKDDSKVLNSTWDM
jgi:hypothetical protein